MSKQRKKRASAPNYISPNQLTLEGFETPFEQSLNPKNRWVELAHIIPSGHYIINVLLDGENVGSVKVRRW